jgi:hypothetical protein
MQKHKAARKSDATTKTATRACPLPVHLSPLKVVSDKPKELIQSRLV